MNNKISVKSYIFLIMIFSLMLILSVVHYFSSAVILFTVFSLITAIFAILLVLFQPAKKIRIRLTDEIEINIG